MAYSQPTFHRGDSQSGFYTATQQQGSAANTGHQNHQARQGHQSKPSRPRLESKSSSSATNSQRELPEFYGTEVDDDFLDEALDHAKKSVESLRQSINRINHNDLDVDSLITLFDDIKKCQKQGDPSCIREEVPELFAGLSKSLGVLLKKINDDIQSDESVVNTLNAEDIHTFFNGLSAIVGESASESLVLKLLAFPSADAQARAIARRGGSNALLLAVKAGNNDIVNALLSLESAGEQARARDINGSNALMLAVAKGNLGIVNAQLSLDSAAEQLTAKDTNGHTAIFIASVFENAAIRERLIAVRDINQS